MTTVKISLISPVATAVFDWVSPNQGRIASAPTLNRLTAKQHGVFTPLNKRVNLLDY